MNLTVEQSKTIMESNLIMLEKAKEDGSEWTIAALHVLLNHIHELEEENIKLKAKELCDSIGG